MKLVLPLLLICTVAATAQPRLSESEAAYLKSLAADTWASIAYMADGTSPLPEDNTDMGGYTSVSNIGFYLASIPAAEKLGLLTHAQAFGRVTRILEACEKLDTWEGFPHSWLRTQDLKPTDERIVSSVDLGNYEAGLIVCRQAYAELGARFGRLIAALNWSALYSPEKMQLYGGWNTRDNSYTNWYYGFYAADSRTASFLAVAHGVPPALWEHLERNLDTPSGPVRYAPGWSGGGLFMQTMTALFLDESATPIGRSAANFAWAQVLRGKAANLPVWGWSACVTPDGKGYIGYGQFREEVVTPHASALTMLYLPHEAIANLHALEGLGSRKDLTIAGRPRRWGFRDCIDVKTRESPNKVLVLDQAMLFLACANVLSDGCVRGWFAKDPICRAGLAKISEYRVDGEQRARFWREVEQTRLSRLPELPLK